MSVAPLAGFKTSTYEGGTRAPFIIKEPPDMVSPSEKSVTNHVIKSFVFVTDMTPTFLDYAKVSPAGSTYKGHNVYPIMGKSIRPLLNGTVERVHAINEPTGTELFNGTGLYLGDWVAVRSGLHPTYPWELYDYVTGPGQNHNLATENQALLQKMITAYQNYSKEVGVVIPRGKVFATQAAHIIPSLNDTQTVQMGFILPETLAVAKSLIENGTFGPDVKSEMQNGTFKAYNYY